jgi:phosphoserine phosphatase
MGIRVAFFDCDGTLTRVKSSWEYLHRRLNIWDDKADQYQAQFRRGEITYHEFCRRDALLWRGLPVSRVAKILRGVPYQPGSRETIRALRERGVITVILSTGLSLLVDRVKKELGFDMALSNEVLSEDGCLTGEIRIGVDYEKKGQLVQKILADIRVAKAEACAVGDGEGDVGMFEAVGFAIGFQPHESLVRVLHGAIHHGSLLELLPMIENHEG